MSVALIKAPSVALVHVPPPWRPGWLRLIVRLYVARTWWGVR